MTPEREEYFRSIAKNNRIYSSPWVTELLNEIDRLRAENAKVSAMYEAMRLAMEIEEEATQRKINDVAHLPEQRQYEQGRADAARAILAVWVGKSQ